MAVPDAISPDPEPLLTAPDGDGHVVLPLLADPHVHLDKALTAQRVANPRGDLEGAIDAWMAFRSSQSTTEIYARARRGLQAFLASGATAVRAHVDTGPDIGLRSVEALLELRLAFDGIVDVQIVACASLPLSGARGREACLIAAEALAAGADALGGAPYLDDAPAAAYDRLIAVALQAGKGLDLHVDETLDRGVFTLPTLLDRVQDGFPHAVAVDHVVSLAVQPPVVRAAVAERLAAARVGVVTLPATNLYLQGRGDRTPTVRGLTAIRVLQAAGVTVAAGADNVRDPFNPTGRFDPLETASLLITAGHLDPESALAAVSSSARELMGLDPTTPEAQPGSDYLSAPGESVADVIAAAPAARTVVRGGRLVARTTVDEWLAEAGS